jgi:quercetin dioxygenase-like cupin family protein
MKQGHKCSIQLHRKKTETVYVLSGRLKLYSGDSLASIKEIILSPNDYITLKPNIVHRMEGLDDCTYLESSTPHLDDVVRLEDEYGRA